MPLLVRATVVLVLVAGCGGSDRPKAAKAPAPHPVTRTVTATASVPAPTTTAESEPATTETQQAAVAPPAGGGAWRDCGRIRSPVDRRPQDVEAKVFDCRAARRVAVRYLRNGALPRGWTPADCAASRAACEQGGWGFRVMQK
jgi:hypothetical protein